MKLLKFVKKKNVFCGFVTFLVTTGQTIFDAMGQVDLCGADTIGAALLDGLLHLGKTPAVCLGLRC